MILWTFAKRVSSSFRGGNVTRAPKTSAHRWLAIYLPTGILISKVELSYRGGSVTMLVMELYWVTPGGLSGPRVWIRQFIREGGDGHVWGTDKNIQPHRHRSLAWYDPWHVRLGNSPSEGGRSWGRLLRGSRG